MFEVSSFGFHFVAANILEGLHVYLFCYYAKYALKKTRSLYLNLPLRILRYFLLSLFGKIGVCLLQTYSSISRPKTKN